MECRHACDRRGIGVWYGTGQPQTDNRPRAFSRFAPTGSRSTHIRSLSLSLSLSLSPSCMYTRARVHVLSFRHVVVNQVLSWWTRANKRTPGTRQCKKRVPRAVPRRSIVIASRRRERILEPRAERQTEGQVCDGNCKRLISNYCWLSRTALSEAPLPTSLSLSLSLSLCLESGI